MARRGAILPLVALLAVVLFGFVALAVDLGVMAVARNQAQNAADSAATAAVRVINGDPTDNYNLSQAPISGITAAVQNTMLTKAVVGDPNNITAVNATTFTSGNVMIELGSYSYYYSDDSSAPPSEGFYLDIPRKRSTDPWGAVRATITANGNKTSFANVFGLSTFNTSAVSVAVHRPRDTVIVVDMSGSMRFQSLPGEPYYGARVNSMNPETVYPQYGHYSDVSGAALYGATSYPTGSGEMYDPSNISTTSNSGPPILADFYQNPTGTAPSSSNQAFSRAPDSYATAPGGDNGLQTSLDAGGTYAKTVQDFNNGSTTTNPKFEVQGYTSVRSAFNGYTQGPGYWGKTFWIWPPSPPGTSVKDPPTSLTDTTYAWHNNQSNDWRQRFFVAVNTATNAPSWLSDNTILFDTGAGRLLKTPGTTTPVTETVNGTTNTVNYTYRINYAAILYWLQNIGPNPFPPTVQAGRIRYYSAIPNGTDTALNNRWWTTSPTSLPNDEQFWKSYIDFVLGFAGTGAGTYTNNYGGTYYAQMIGNGAPYTWAGSTVSVTQRPQPQGAAGDPDAPAYETGSTTTTAPANSATFQASGLASTPVVNRDYTIVGGDTANPYLITAVSPTSGTSATVYTLTISPKLANAISAGKTVQIFSPYMSYTDNPPRPKHHLWFGPMTWLDWLGNYNANNWWWPGNVHEAQGWQCKVGIQTAIADVKNNHPCDLISLVYFSSPKYSNSSAGQWNQPIVAMGRKYQQIQDSLWFPPSTIYGGAGEIGPYDPDMAMVPRAHGGTCPAMAFMLAYNQLSSSAASLRTYATPQPTYRGLDGGLGRVGAQKLVIYETDGAPNTLAAATLAGSGPDAYYPVRVKDPTNLSSGANVEWPANSGSLDPQIYAVVGQITADVSASGFSTARKPALVHCIAFGSLYEPANAGTAQSNALAVLEQIQYLGNTQASSTTGMPDYKLIYGSPQQRINKMQKAFTAILQDGVQVSLIQ
jgi:hypothetical protein